jgi:hypothetical protein
MYGEVTKCVNVIEGKLDVSSNPIVPVFAWWMIIPPSMSNILIQ